MKEHWWQINRCRTFLPQLAICIYGNLQTGATSLVDEVSDWTLAGLAIFQSLSLVQHAFVNKHSVVCLELC